MTKQFVLATGNAHKIVELKTILAQEVEGFDADALVSHKELGIDDPVEDGKTFAENALIKARHVCAKTGKYAIADDSGLSVEIMGGAPGIFSARWSGKHGQDEANNELLLKQMGDIKPENRKAKFVAAAALVCPDGREFTEIGEVEGTLLFEPVGENGFGYDPIFMPDGFDKSFAELGPEVKNEYSHRKRAFTKLAAHIQNILAEQ